MVVDAANGASSARGRAVLVDGTRRLLELEARLGITRHVAVSIVGAERVPLAYYRLKVEQERLVAGSPVPWTLLRATQFHEFVDQWLTTAARWRVRPTALLPLQPVAATDVALVLADLAERPATGGRVEVAGPHVRELGSLSREWAAARGRRGVPLRLPLVGAAGRALRDGGLTCATPDVLGATPFARWLTRTG